MSSKLSKRLPRPSLAWLSIQDIIDVRNKLIGLFLAPGECVYEEVKVDGAITKIEVSFSGIAPKFRYGCLIKRSDGSIERRHIISWLKIPKQGLPYWDVEVLDELCVGVGFKRGLTLPVVKLFKKWKRHFPHKPTNNFLLNNGNPII